LDPKKTTIFGRLLRARKRTARRLRHEVRKLVGKSEYERLLDLKDVYQGLRCVLIANGPSLLEHDLTRLANEHVCLVNMGIKILGDRLDRAEFHVITDNNRYRRFAAECEAYALAGRIKHRFYPFACRKTWQQLGLKAERPYFLMSNPQAFSKRGMVSDPRDGYSGSSTVLLSALQLIFFLGFEEVVLIGCDLDYGKNDPYFYAMSELDRKHELDASVVARRASLKHANSHFEIALRFYQDQGRRLINAGPSPNLSALPRRPFDELFSSATESGRPVGSKPSSP
jgi:hypothetical protein